MDESMWERYGATAGVVFVVLVLGSVFLAGAPPHIDASAGKIATYFESSLGRVASITIAPAA